MTGTGTLHGQLHQDTHTNPACGVGVNIQLVLADCYREVQQNAEEKMREIMLAEILARYYQKLDHQASHADQEEDVKL